MKCPTWREGILVLVFKINKDVMSFFFPNHCSMCDWIYVYDQIMMLIRLLFQIYLIIISLYVVIMVWGRYNSFLGVRGARRGLKRKLGPAFSLSGVDLSHLWSCLYMLVEHCASLFQPQYVDGLLNPSHRILSFTTELATPLGIALSVWGFSWFLSVFCIVSGPSCHLGTLYKSDRRPPLPS